MTNQERIEINPAIMQGKPVIRGTRIPVELLLRKLGEGATENDLLDAYPNLNAQDLRAAMIYAADTLAHEETLLAIRRRTKGRRRRGFLPTKAATLLWSAPCARRAATYSPLSKRCRA